MSGTTEVAPAAVPPGPAPRPPRARAAVWFPVAIVVVLVVGIGIGLVFTRDDGASSPEQALDQLVAAIESGDAAEVLLALPPSERKALADGVPDLADHLEALGLIEGGTDSGPGLPSLRVDGLRVSTTPYDREVVAVDLIGGRLTLDFGPGEGLPLTDAGEELLAGPGGTVPPDGTVVSRDLALEPIRLIAIREGGGWHISVAYSIVDALVADGGVAVPAIGGGPFAFGGGSPEAAVVDFVRAYADGYLDRLISVLAADEARSLYDYAPVILPGTSQQVEDLRVTGAYDVILNSITTSVDGRGDTRTVTVTGLDLDIRDQVHKIHVVLADRCLRIDERIDDDDQPYVTYEVCADEWEDPDAATRPLDNPVGNAAIFGGGAELPTFTVVERNGRWFVSPIRSLLDATIGTLDQLDPDQQRAFLERLVRSARAGAGDGLIGDPLPADLTPEDRAATLIARCDALLPDDATPPAGADPAAGRGPDPNRPGGGGSGPDGSGGSDPGGVPELGDEGGGDPGGGPAAAGAGSFAESVRRDCVDRLVRTGSIAWDAIPPERREGLAPPPSG